MKNSWMKKALVSVILFAIAITSVPYGLIAEAAAKDTTEAVSVVLNGVVTDEDNRLPGGTYTLEADTTFSGNGDLWTFEKKTVIDLNGHTLTLDGVTLSIETGELSITDSIGNGQIYSENSQLFHITYKRSRTLSFENVLLVYGGTDTTMLPVWAECQIFLFDSSIQTTSEYAVYAGGDLWLWGATFSGFTNAEVILGIDGELCYFEGYETCQNPIQVSLKGVDLSEACSKSLIVPSENGNVPRSITDIVTFTELPENCQIRYLNGEYDAISLPLIELSGSYDLGDNMFPGISLDETGSYQMGNAYYKLTGNVSFSSEAVDGGEFLNIFLADGKEVILDLNGYTINIDTMTIRAESGNFTLIDTVGGGILNGGFYFDGRGGSFQMDSGTYNIIENPRVKPMRNIPFLLFGYSRFTITGGSINCYYSTAEMIEGMTPIIDINGGEINFYPKKNNSGHVDMFQVGSYKRDAVSVTGGTIRMQGTGVMNMFNLLEGNLDISGGNFILKYEGSNESCFEKSALVNSEFSMNVNVSGGSFTTNTTHCFVNSSYKSDTPLMHFSGCPAFHVAKYDYSSKLHWGRKDSVLNSIEIKTDFNIGRKLNYYAEKTPTEETPIIFVRNWTQNRGEEDPSDVMNIYLPEDKVCTPVVSDGNVTSGTIFDAPEPEPEYVDGLRVYELSGNYSLPNLEVPNTTAQDTADKYNWADGYYRLTGNTEISTSVPDSKATIKRLYANQNVVIDLNGHALTFDAIQFQASKGCSFTIIDSSKGGSLTGELYFYGNGNYYFYGGTINGTQPIVRTISTWMFNLSGGEMVVDGAVINGYHDCETIMIQMASTTFRMKSGEINYIPTGEIREHTLDMIFSYNSDIHVSGGTMNVEASEPGYLMSVSASTVSISGGSLRSKCTGVESKKRRSRIITTEVIHKADITISGGNFVTTGDACVDVPYELGSELTLGGHIEMNSAKYDLSFLNVSIPPVYIQSDFEMGRKLTCYSSKAIPSEEQEIVFVKDWVKNKGAEDPKEYFRVYLPDNQSLDPYVLDNNAVCGGASGEPEVIDGLEVKNLQGTYNLTNLEVPNTTRKEEGKDSYYWNDGYYRLVGDTTFTAELINSSNALSSVYINENVIIDLNGYTLTVDPIRFQTTADCNFT
ncbi:MAG: hypothetical protein K6F30_08965, partial [Lachnospiraceae bacterium]|nr:hypothetical protein [Lachnospiraceae bacterium]